jgi:hypothetical protein
VERKRLRGAVFLWSAVAMLPLSHFPTDVWSGDPSLAPPASKESPLPMDPRITPQKHEWEKTGAKTTNFRQRHEWEIRSDSRISLTAYPLPTLAPSRLFHVFQIPPLPLGRCRSRCPVDADQQKPRSFAPLGVAGTAPQSIPTLPISQLSAEFRAERAGETPALPDRRASPFLTAYRLPLTAYLSDLSALS